MILKMFMNVFNCMLTWLFSILQIFIIAQEDEIVQFLMSSSKMASQDSYLQFNLGKL
jgi:hypothetical protein